MSAKSLAEWRAKNKKRVAEYSKQYYAKNRLRLCENARKYVDENRDLVRERRRKYRIENKDRIRAAFDAWRIKKSYGISVERWAEIKQSQNNLCGACGRAGRLVLDHCHETGTVRGALCGTCNMALGQARDSVDVLLGLVSYLRRSHERIGKQ